jgi:hypothetical protein
LTNRFFKDNITMEVPMLAERILHDKSELISIIDNWSAGGEKLLLFEKGDTLVLKKMSTKISSFADDSYNDKMTMDEVVKEVHKQRRA